MRERVMGYIDGFNLSFGLREKGWQRYLWLDPFLLVENLLKPHQALVGVKYFTALLTGTGAHALNQKSFLEANETLGKCSFHFGRYQLQRQRCRKCGFESDCASEKMTDVKIAIEILSDAYRNLFDSALLIGGDSDLVPVLEAVNGLFGKRTIVAFPPKRVSRHLKATARAHLFIGGSTLSSSQLPSLVQKEDGVTLARPGDWT